ncbi:MAG: YIP1 family protein [Oscillospiraceae bacterium]|nr:YIP1 family protein [Oscillospiraceae bacterium]
MTALASLKRKETYIKLLNELRYALYCIFHPADGFWCISREKKASVASAHVLLALYAIIEVLRLTLTNFQFVRVNMEYFNALFAIGSIILPIALWSVANWAFTTLMNGKGKLSDVYIATVYAFTPVIICNAVGIVISQFITYDERELYFTMLTVATIWSIMLVLVAMMQIHDYTLLKAVASSFLAILGIGFMLFIFMLFFSLISDAVMYFISLINEIVFRLY